MGLFDFFKRNKNKKPKEGVCEIYYDNGEGPLECTVNVVDGYRGGVAGGEDNPYLDEDTIKRLRNYTGYRDGLMKWYRRDGKMYRTEVYKYDLYDRKKMYEIDLKASSDPKKYKKTERHEITGDMVTVNKYIKSNSELNCGRTIEYYENGNLESIGNWYSHETEGPQPTGLHIVYRRDGTLDYVHRYSEPEYSGIFGKAKGLDKINSNNTQFDNIIDGWDKLSDKELTDIVSKIPVSDIVSKIPLM